MTELLSSVGLVARAELRYVMIELARRLKERHGSRVHLYCNDPQQVAFYEKEGAGILATVTDAGILSRAARESGLDAAAVIAKARKYEGEIGCTYNTLALGNRHLGRGYALAGFYHPRSRLSEETDYIQMLHAYNAVLEFWDHEIEDKGLRLILQGSPEVARLAATRGVAHRHLTRTRYRSYHYWAENEFLENPAFERAYHAVPSVEGAKAEITEPYVDEIVRRKQRLKGATFTGLVWRLGHDMARQAYWWMRGYEKAKGYYLRDKLDYHVRYWAAAREVTGTKVARLANLEDMPFVFFPLGTEPEINIHIRSPEYFYQQAAIAALSRDLPAGVRLVVKEHTTAVGRRPDKFYEQIRRLKNVVMLDMLERGHEVVRRAAAVATISGTAGFEAAVMGKPVIAFGRHNVYNFLPHVMVVTDETKLRDYLEAVFNGDVDLDRARADGARFLQALIDSSFDMRGYDYSNFRNVDGEAIEDAYQGLVSSLKGTGKVELEQISAKPNDDQQVGTF
ncbi:MAG: hypothetical protein IH986_14160 [Planctomycetes bacterium]|nr:hypothetical protein [Planctomycetota bacterium]